MRGENTGDQAKDNYLNELFGIKDSDVEALRAAVLQHPRGHMSITPSEARMLQFLVRGFGIRTVVEFGTFLGFSALCMAKALPADGKVFSLEKDPEHARLAGGLIASSDVADKIQILTGEALPLAQSLVAQGPFDMVFIDADKSGYVDYLDWAERNVRRGGLIIGDNTFLWGAVWDAPSRDTTSAKQTAAMKEFNARLADPKRYNSILIPTLEGMTIAQVL
jgi:caffeoyl-CoA O-methyltransferase